MASMTARGSFTWQQLLRRGFSVWSVTRNKDARVFQTKAFKEKLRPLLGMIQAESEMDGDRTVFQFPIAPDIEMQIQGDAQGFLTVAAALTAPVDLRDGTRLLAMLMASRIDDGYPLLSTCLDPHSLCCVVWARQPLHDIEGDQALVLAERVAEQAQLCAGIRSSLARHS